MEADLKQVGPVAHPALLCEPPWDDETFSPPSVTSSQSTPTIASASYSSGSGPAATSAGVAYGSQQQRPVPGNGKSSSSPPGNQLAEVPTQLFYPFYPEYSLPSSAGGAVNGVAGNQQRDYAQLLEVAAAAQDGTYGCQPSHDSFISEERDPHRGFQQGVQMSAWMGAVSAFPALL